MYSCSKVISVLIDKLPFNLIIYPNPVSDGKFSITGNIKSSEQPVLVEIINSFGEVLFQKNLQPATTRFSSELEVNQLPAGIYFVQFRQGLYKSVQRIIIY